MGTLHASIENACHDTCDLQGTFIVDNSKYPMTSIELTDGMTSDALLIIGQDWETLELSLAAQPYSHIDYFSTYAKIINSDREGLLCIGPTEDEWEILCSKTDDQTTIEIVFGGLDYPSRLDPKTA